MPVIFTPTLRQLIQKAQSEFGCQLEIVEINDVISGGTVATPVRYLTRLVDGEPVEAILPSIHDHERVTHEKLREICNYLRLPSGSLFPTDPWDFEEEDC